MARHMVHSDTRQPAPNHEAHLLLGGLIVRAGLQKVEFLARLAEFGYCVSDDTFANWGRLGRAFPRDWALLAAMLRILRDPRLHQRCSAADALRFCHLIDLPFSELHLLAQLFPQEEFARALVPYLPEGFLETVVGARNSAGPTMVPSVAER